MDSLKMFKRAYLADKQRPKAIRLTNSGESQIYCNCIVIYTCIYLGLQNYAPFYLFE